MNLNLKEKTVIITGGTKGIGAGIAEAFAKEGANLILAYRSDDEHANEFMDYLINNYKTRVYCIKKDLSEEESAKEIIDFAIEKFNGLDILINNAGTTKRIKYNIQDLSEDEWQNALKGNVSHYYRMSKYFSLWMIENNRKGSIIFILSKASMSTTHKGNATYVTNKTAELGLMRQLAVDLCDYGIIVNGIMPGSVKNENYKLRSEEFINERCKRIPLGRYNEPIEIGYLATFIASDKNQTMLGAAVDATGGMLLGF